METFTDLNALAAHFRELFRPPNPNEKKKQWDSILLYAHNGIGKTRLSMAFKDLGKTAGARDTLYFNAFTEDLFSWDNDLDGDSQRVLQLNTNSVFFTGIQDLEMETRIGPRFQRYADLNFFIDYDNSTVTFSRSIKVDGNNQSVDHIKISRGEENIFIWCFFLAIVEIAMVAEEGQAYSWVKYLYIDDPISSLDENNAIAVATDLASLIKQEDNRLKTVISTHHSLFFNVMFNEFRRGIKSNSYFLYHKPGLGYSIQNTTDTPFFHHIAMLKELKQVAETEQIYTYHFNTLRTILEKTASFLGYSDFKKCLEGIEDEALFNRALNLMSHGRYSIYEPRQMIPDNKDLFRRVLRAFLEKYDFADPTLFIEDTPQAPQE